jgi:hypothetical protein
MLVSLVIDAQDPAAEHSPMKVKHATPTEMLKRMKIPVPLMRCFVAAV